MPQSDTLLGKIVEPTSTIIVVQECRSCIGGEDASGSHGFALSAVLFAGSALAYDAYDPNNCKGVDWETSAP